MNIKAVLAVAAVAALGATAAYAERGLEKADTSGDGFVSLDELKAAHSARIEEHFSRMDSNADGLLSEEEIKAAHETRRGGHDGMRKGKHHGKRSPEEMLERLDADGNGSVSLDELEGKRFSPDAATFRAADSDSSGGLDANELHTIIKAHRDERRAAREGESND